MRYKYPRTPHLPWSPGADEDDIILDINDVFDDEEVVVVTEKMDGECTTIYPDYIHARSLDSADHPSRHLVKALQGAIGPFLGKEMRICGENMYAKHSIHYTDLESLFLVFSIWEGDDCWNWKDTVRFCRKMELYTVPYLWGDYMNAINFDLCYTENRKPDLQEGYVVRKKASFKYEDFQNNVAKFVRKDHVQTSEHWLNQPLVKNQCRKM